MKDKTKFEILTEILENELEILENKLKIKILENKIQLNNISICQILIILGIVILIFK